MGEGSARMNRGSAGWRSLEGSYHSPELESPASRLQMARILESGRKPHDDYWKLDKVSPRQGERDGGGGVTRTFLCVYIFWKN